MIGPALCDNFSTLYNTPVKKAILVGGLSIKCAIMIISALSFLQVIHGINGLTSFALFAISWGVLPATFAILNQLSSPSRPRKIVSKSESSQPKVEVDVTPKKAVKTSYSFHNQKSAKRHFKNKFSCENDKSRVALAEGSPVETLPKVMLVRIFQNLTDKDLTRVRLLSKKWRNAADFLLGKKLHLRCLEVAKSNLSKGALESKLREAQLLCQIAQMTYFHDPKEARKILSEVESMEVPDLHLALEIQSLKIDWMSSNEAKIECITKYLAKLEIHNGYNSQGATIYLFGIKKLATLDVKKAISYLNAATYLHPIHKAESYFEIAKCDGELFSKALEVAKNLAPNETEEIKAKDKLLGELAIFQAENGNYNLFEDTRSDTRAKQLFDQADIIDLMHDADDKKLVWNKLVIIFAQKAAAHAAKDIRNSKPSMKPLIQETLHIFVTQALNKMPHSPSASLRFMIAKALLVVPDAAQYFAETRLKHHNSEYLRFCLIFDCLIPQELNNNTLRSLPIMKKNEVLMEEKKRIQNEVVRLHKGVDENEKAIIFKNLLSAHYKVGAQEKLLIFEILLSWNPTAAISMVEQLETDEDKLYAYCSLFVLGYNQYLEKAKTLAASQKTREAQLQFLLYIFEKQGLAGYYATLEIANSLQLKTTNDDSLIHNIDLYLQLIPLRPDPSSQKALIVRAQEAANKIKNRELKKEWCSNVASLKTNSDSAPPTLQKYQISIPNKEDSLIREDEAARALFLVENVEHAPLRKAFSQFMKSFDASHEMSQVEKPLEFAKMLEKAGYLSKNFN